MKKIMISLLMMAASLNAMAVTYSGKVKVRLTSSDNKYCEAVVATSDDLNDGLNNSYYAPFNDENKDVHLYVEFGGTRYAHFGSSANTLRNMPLIMKANEATSYSLSFSAMVGTIEIYDTELGDNIDKSQVYNFTIDAGQVNQIIADRFIINYTPYSVTLNDDYLATFSAADDVEIPAGLSAWYSVDGIENDVLTLLPVSGKIPANTGVVLYNANGDEKNFSLPITTGADAIATNLLKPASAWASHSGTIYILHGHELWVYEGTEMKENKAYLQINTTSAPARIRLAFGQTTGVENVEADAVKAEKFVENGQIFIRRGNEVFNLQGQIVK